VVVVAKQKQRSEFEVDEPRKSMVERSREVFGKGKS